MDLMDTIAKQYPPEFIFPALPGESGQDEKTTKTVDAKKLGDRFCSVLVSAINRLGLLAGYVKHIEVTFEADTENAKLIPHYRIEFALPTSPQPMLLVVEPPQGAELPGLATVSDFSIRLNETLVAWIRHQLLLQVTRTRSALDEVVDAMAVAQHPVAR